MAVGCNALVGIQEGAPATTDSGSGDNDGAGPSGDSGSGIDSNMPTRDSGSGADGTTPGDDSGSDADGAMPVADSGSDVDSTVPVGDSGSDADATIPVGDSGSDVDATIPVGDSGSDADATTPPGDSGSDSGDAGFIPVSCTPSTPVLVDDLANEDAALGTTFNHQMWVVPGQEGDGVYIVNSTQNEFYWFTLYQASFSGQATVATQLGNAPFGNMRLIDVEPTSNGGQSVLVSYMDDAGLGGLELVPLPYTLGANPPSPPTNIAQAFFPAMMSFPNGGTFTTLDNGVAWILDIKNGSAGTQTFYSGATVTPDAGPEAGPEAGQGPELLFTTTSQPNGSVPFVATDSTLYAFVQGLLGDGGGGANSSTLLTYPATFDTPPTWSPVNSTAPLSTVLAAHFSVQSPGNVLVLALNANFSSGSAQVFSALTPPSGLTSLSIGAAPFAAGSNLSTADIPFNAGSQVWEGDHLLVAGAGSQSPNDLTFMWIDPNGFVLTRGVLIPRQNPIQTTAIGANASPPVVEGFGSFFVAWTERVSEGGQHDQLWVAKVLCVAATDQ